jgi:hypothetical protein
VARVLVLMSESGFLLFIQMLQSPNFSSASLALSAFVADRYRTRRGRPTMARNLGGGGTPKMTARTAGGTGHQSQLLDLERTQQSKDGRKSRDF